MRLQRLADVVAVRFNLDDAPITASIDDRDFPDSTDLQSSVEIQETALAIWEQLTTREQQILPILEMSARDISKSVGLGKSQVAVAQARIRELLRSWLVEDPNAGEVFDQLQTLAGQQSNRTSE
jgi:DNA-directed RNA polymerase specialized sigma subunit